MILKIALENTEEWAWIGDLMSGPERMSRPSLIPEIPARASAEPSEAEEAS
jgi:hypothetical protein